MAANRSSKASAPGPITQGAAHLIWGAATMRPGGGNTPPLTDSPPTASSSLPLKEKNVAQLGEKSGETLVKEWKAKAEKAMIDPEELDSAPLIEEAAQKDSK